MIIFILAPDPLIKCDFEEVYIPAEDSYLLIDYFKRNLDQNHFDGIKLSNIKNVLDLGTGTGIIALFFQLYGIQKPKFRPNIFASDILEEAIKCAEINEKLNNINKEISFIKSDLFKSFPTNLQNIFNIIVFNPPYLPSSQLIKKNINKKAIDFSWDGGLKGFEILIKFLTKAKTFLNVEKDHYIYCVSSSRTNLTEFNKQIKNLGYKNVVVDKKHVFFEDILLNRLNYIQD